MDSRRFGRAYRSRGLHARPHARGLRDLLRREVPRPRAQAGRPLRLSPAYPRLAELGAAFGEKSGWERANWFEPNAARGDESLRPRGWAGRLWSPAIGAEHLACRETAALFDETSFAKIEVSGEGAADFLERLCANRVARDVGAITYTSMLNARGGIECDFTVTRLGRGPLPDRHRHRVRPARPRLDPRARARRRDRRGRHLRLRLLRPLGPEGARDPAAAHDDAARLPATCGRASSRSAPCRASRSGSPTSASSAGSSTARASSGCALWDAIWEPGAELGLVAGGYRAIDSLRLEKGYRVWGSDITPDDTPFEAGLGFAVKLDKGDFIGREALLVKQSRAAALLPRARRPARGRARLGAGAGRRDGASAASRAAATATRSSARSPTPTCRPTRAAGQPVEVEIFGEWVAGEVAAEPLFDPAGERVRA